MPLPICTPQNFLMTVADGHRDALYVYPALAVIDLSLTSHTSPTPYFLRRSSLLPSLDEGYILETLIAVMQHALSINSLLSSWLKSYAEIQYGQSTRNLSIYSIDAYLTDGLYSCMYVAAVGNMRDALKYYLSAASVASNHFMEPVPFYVFDSEV